MGQYNSKGGLGGEWWAVVGVLGTLFVVGIFGAVFYYLNSTPSQAPQPVDINSLVANAVSTVVSRVTPASTPLVVVSTPEIDISAALSEITGKVEFKQVGEGSFSPAYAGAKLKPGGQIQTGTDGKVRLDLSSGTIIRVTPSSIFTLTTNEKVDKGLATRIKLDIGWIFIILNGGSADVETPAGVASVRGSYLAVRYDASGGTVSLTCLEGNCSVTTTSGPINFTNGQKVIFTKNANGQWSTLGVTPMTDVDTQNWLTLGLNTSVTGNITGNTTGLTIQGLGTTNGQISFSVVVSAGQIASAGGVCEFTAGTGNSVSSTTLQVVSGATTFLNLSNQGCRITHTSVPNTSKICFAAIPNRNSVIYFFINSNWIPQTTTLEGGKVCTSGSPNPAGEYRIGAP